MTTVKLLTRDAQADYGAAIVEWGEKALDFLRPDNWRARIHGAHYAPRGRRPEPNTIAIRDGGTFLSFRFAILGEDIFGDLEKGLQERRQKVKTVVTTLLVEADTASRKRFREVCKEVSA